MVLLGPILYILLQASSPPLGSLEKGPAKASKARAPGAPGLPGSAMGLPNHNPALTVEGGQVQKCARTNIMSTGTYSGSQRVQSSDFHSHVSN